MKIPSLFTLLGWLLAFSIAAPAASLDARDSSIEKRAPLWQFYYDTTAADHQTNFNKWSAAGYRMISLSVYGAPPNNKYAAVWVQRSGPAWVAIHQANAAAYQAWFDSNNAAGYVSTIVTVTGPANAPTYAGVMEKSGVSSWYQKCGLNPATFSSHLQNMAPLQINNTVDYGMSIPSLTNTQLLFVRHTHNTKSNSTARQQSHIGDHLTWLSRKITKSLPRSRTPILGRGSLVTGSLPPNFKASILPRKQMAGTSSIFKVVALG